MSTSRVCPLAARYSSEQLVAEAHLLQDRELDLEELDRRTSYGDLRLGDDRRGEQRHRLDRVLARRVVDIDVDDRLPVMVSVVVPMPSTSTPSACR